MPSPVGHSLIGYAAYARWKKGAGKPSLLLLGIFFFVANLPDIDLLYGLFFGNADLYHHHLTHSIVFCAAASIVAGGLVHLFVKSGAVKTMGVFFALLLTHLLFDALTLDTRQPYGQMLLWPFSEVYYAVPLVIFQDIQRIGSSDLFFKSLMSKHNLIAVMLEAAIVSPLCFFLIFRPEHTDKTGKGEGEVT